MHVNKIKHFVLHIKTSVNKGEEGEIRLASSILAEGKGEGHHDHLNLVLRMRLSVHNLVLSGTP